MKHSETFGLLRFGCSLPLIALMVGCGSDGGGTEPTPVNQAPVAAGSIPAQTLTAGTTATVDVAPYFSDPDGDALTYAATTSDAAVTAASVSGSTLTVSGVAAGGATLTVTATDPGGLSGWHFRVDSHLLAVLVVASSTARIPAE